MFFYPEAESDQFAALYSVVIAIVISVTNKPHAHSVNVRQFSYLIVRTRQMPKEATKQPGMRAMTVRHADHPSMPVALFYPSLSPTKQMHLGPYAPVLAFNGSLELPLKGVILLSHGSGGSHFVHVNLAIRLAKSGYLVAAPQHSGDNWSDRSLVFTPGYFAERTR
ncbi:hypothetical protein [Glaciimonas sp. PAMC28666]|uniref:hypothetical protein n=1 Tax=Glaciimonas sp. PAMC28666 TaxID=2807626 RepID=UPI0019656BAA|nr:hypothetical protein [Glaciimonas sp. PAMC28666]QRX83463.1 hypothetical protein JQN73_04245 [Glaciimonas sp. PAMC28666]